MTKSPHLALLLICAITLADCNGNPPQEVPDAELVGTLWTLGSIELPGEPAYLVGSSTTVNIQFSEDYRLNGNSFCNSYFGIFTLSENNEMRFDSLGTTLIGCKMLEKDKEYYRALHFVYSYDINGHILRLYYDNGSVLKYGYIK